MVGQGGSVRLLGRNSGIWVADWAERVVRWELTRAQLSRSDDSRSGTRSCRCSERRRSSESYKLSPGGKDHVGLPDAIYRWPYSANAVSVVQVSRHDRHFSRTTYPVDPLIYVDGVLMQMLFGGGGASIKMRPSVLPERSPKTP